MAIAIPDFSTYTDEELLDIADVQFTNYIEASESLAQIAENPAQDAVDNFFATLGTTINIEDLTLNADSGRALVADVNVQKEGFQDKFDYAEAFAFEWFHRFYPTSGFFQVKFNEILKSIDYDSGTDTITITAI